VAAGAQFERPGDEDLPFPCAGVLPATQTDGSGKRQPLGETCAPPVRSQVYFHDSVTIGAFATDIQLAAIQKNRIFVPVRGDASVTWFDVPPDLPGAADYSASFHLECGQGTGDRCDDTHHAGRLGDAQNSRALTLPGEPFGMAQSEDGTYLVLTHQSDTKATLMSTGLAAPPTLPTDLPETRCTQAPTPQPVTASADPLSKPSMLFVLDGLPFGGNGIASVSHDPCAFYAPAGAPAPELPRPSFVETMRSVAELDLLRFYSDQGAAAGGMVEPGDPRDPSSSLFRPYLVREAAFPLTANASGVDSRGIALDDTPRRACKIKVYEDATLTGEERNRRLAACARTPLRVFIANRSPASMILGQIGEEVPAADGTYSADRITLFGNVPLTFGPSRVYLAPIVDANGNYALRVFIVCFDSQTLFIWDPDAGQVENIIHVGQGPFAMAFDPFDWDDVAAHRPAPLDADGMVKHKYRFGYVASFTNSFVQLIDLDDTIHDKSTYERVVFTLGIPRLPKGSH
jgi:hypothetical protein